MIANSVALVYKLILIFQFNIIASITIVNKKEALANKLRNI